MSPFLPSYYPGSSDNGENFDEIWNLNVPVIVNAPFGGVVGDVMPAATTSTIIEQTNISTLVGRTATNVEYFLDPLLGTLGDLDYVYTTGNWFDGDLTADGVQHDTLPYFVHGGLDKSGNFVPGDLNWDLAIRTA